MSDDSLRSGVIPFVVRNPAGEIDVELSDEKFLKSLASYKAQSEIEAGLIGAAVDNVFSTVSKRMNMAALKTFVLQDKSLNVNGQNFAAIEQMFLNYMSANTDINKRKERKNAKTGEVTVKAHPGEKYGTRLFHTTKGPGGGTVRVKDFPEAPKEVSGEDDSE